MRRRAVRHLDAQHELHRPQVRHQCLGGSRLDDQPRRAAIVDDVQLVRRDAVGPDGQAVDLLDTEALRQGRPVTRALAVEVLRKA